MSHSGLQLLLLLGPTRLLILGFLVDRRAFGFDGVCLGLIFLEAQVDELRSAVSTGYARRRYDVQPRND